MDQEVETVVVYCYKCGELERRPNFISESEDKNVIENIAHKHIQENPGHVVLAGFEISDNCGASFAMPVGPIVIGINGNTLPKNIIDDIWCEEDDKL